MLNHLERLFSQMQQVFCFAKLWECARVLASLLGSGTPIQSDAGDTSHSNSQRFRESSTSCEKGAEQLGMPSGLLRRFFESLVGMPPVFRQIPGCGLGARRLGRTIHGLPKF